MTANMILDCEFELELQIFHILSLTKDEAVIKLQIQGP